MALWNSPRACGEASMLWTETPPAEKPKIVTLFGLPPIAAIFRFTHCKAAI
jgi:hypothetical protein